MTTLAVHPGAVDTELLRHVDKTYSCCVIGSLNVFKRYFFKTPEMGAQTTIYCATEESLVNHSGQYFRFFFKVPKDINKSLKSCFEK